MLDDTFYDLMECQPKRRQPRDDKQMHQRLIELESAALVAFRAVAAPAQLAFPNLHG